MSEGKERDETQTIRGESDKSRQWYSIHGGQAGAGREEDSSPLLLSVLHNNRRHCVASLLFKANNVHSIRN